MAFINPKCFIWNKISLDLDELISLSSTHRLLCLYDSKLNCLQDQQITSSKLSKSVLDGLRYFVSNKSSSTTKTPVIILNGLGPQSIQMIKSDPVLRAPKSFNISVIFIGPKQDFESMYPGLDEKN